MSEKQNAKPSGAKNGEMLHGDSKTEDVRISNIIAAKSKKWRNRKWIGKCIYRCIYRSICRLIMNQGRSV